MGIYKNSRNIRDVSQTIYDLRWITDTDFNKGTLDSELEVSGTGDAAVLRPADIADSDDDIDYETAGEYTASDGAKIEVASGQAQLKALSGSTYTYPYTTSGNYTFDSDKIEVTGGVARLKDQRPADATFYAGYASVIDGDWGDGTLTGTGSGSPTITSGELDLTGGTSKYVDYDADANADSQQVGCVRFHVRPDYSGTPVDFQLFLFIIKANGDRSNAVGIAHNTTGHLRIIIDDSSASSIIAQDMGSWSPVSGTQYEIELNWDITTGATRLFVDGVQFGSTQTATGTRDANIAVMRAGNNHLGTNNTRFKLDNLLYFSTVQHTANYTPGSAPEPTIYATDDPTIENSTGDAFSIALASFTEDLAAEPTNTDVQYVVSSDNGSTYEYWTGAAWATSDSSWAQSNTAADINSNISTLASSGTFKFKALLRSTTGDVRPELDEVEVTGTPTFSTDDDLYVDTKDAAQLIPSDLIAWLTMVFTSSTPGSTDAKVMLSNDGRTSWLTFTGGSWQAPTSETDRDEATSLADATSNIGSFPIGDETLDVRLFLYTSDSSATPTVSNINVTGDGGYETSGDWESNVYDSGNIDQLWDKIFREATEGSNSSVTISARAGNSTSEVAAASYTEFSNYEITNLVGKHVQLKAAFAGLQNDRAILDRLSIFRKDPKVTVQAP